MPMPRYRLDIATWVGLLLLSVLLIYWRTTLSMVSIWETSATFTHGFIVIPIFFYFLWTRRQALSAIEPRPCFAALLGIAACGALWLVGELVSAVSVSQLAMMGMVPFAVWAVLGTRIAKTLAIPLVFLFFAVPVGDFLVPTLMNWTADFAVAALRASGVPVYREGNLLLIPTGSWSIVEACSGLRYLIASFMIGCLYAYITYRSSVRRALFIAASLIVPIIANWLRAYIVIMLGHLTNNQLAAGVDHLIYGWIFFGIVMLLMLWVGARWREDQDRGSPGGTEARRQDAVSIGHHSSIALLAAFALMAVWQPLLAHFAGHEPATRIDLGPISGRGGWVPIRDEFSGWRPDLAGARAEVRQTFEKDGVRVGLHIAFFRDQTKDAKVVTSVNQLVRPTNKLWTEVESGAVAADVAGALIHVRSAVIAGNGKRLAAWQWYWVDGSVTSNDYVAKFYQALSVLKGHGDPAAWVIVFTTTPAGEEQARPMLKAFTAEMGTSVEAALKQAASK